ncbi:hypothetical protein SAMN04487917_103132 [Arthrobacter sp. yr096]|nr:hypothetical protein SAMN04487917_103132 [Arthrobacter sp. yr096]
MRRVLCWSALPCMGVKKFAKTGSVSAGRGRMKGVLADGNRHGNCPAATRNSVTPSYSGPYLHSGCPPGWGVPHWTSCLSPANVTAMKFGLGIDLFLPETPPLPRVVPEGNDVRELAAIGCAPVAGDQHISGEFAGDGVVGDDWTLAAIEEPIQQAPDASIAGCWGWSQVIATRRRHALPRQSPPK